MDRQPKITSLLNKIDSLKVRKETIIEEAELCDSLLANSIHEYRVESVSRILDFILSEYREGRLVKIDLLLTHCINKLNGNLDGVELSLSEPGKPVAMFPISGSGQKK